MRTKLFLAFLLVIFIALISNLIFEWLIMKDFDEYIKGRQEDHLYWMLASIEGSYQNGRWNMDSLSEAVHWGMMLGFDIEVRDRDGREVTDSHKVMATLPPPMKRRMESIIAIYNTEGDFEKYPLYIEGREVGTLYIRALKMEGPIRIKEAIFKERGKNFLIISFLIAGLGAIAIAVFLSLYLSRPIKRLKSAAEKVARGDFGARVVQHNTRGFLAKDEIAMLSDSFNYMAEALEKEESLRRHLTSNIAHELRTPLSIMKAHVEAITDGVITDISGGIENLRGEIDKLTRLIEGIEDLTKAEASFFSRGENRMINLRDLLKGIEYAMGPMFQAKGLGFSLTDRGEINVATDADKLDRIIKNILSNALKFTVSGGVVVDYGRQGGGFYVEIKDTGIGIPEDDIPRIFTKFYRGRDASDNGIGIGLAIVKELVSIMGGTIEVSSIVGEGSTFRVWLPAHPLPQPSALQQEVRA